MSTETQEQQYLTSAPSSTFFSMVILTFVCGAGSQVSTCVHMLPNQRLMNKALYYQREGSSVSDVIASRK